MLKFDVDGKNGSISVQSSRKDSGIWQDEENWEARVAEDLRSTETEQDEDGRWQVCKADFEALATNATRYADHWSEEDSEYDYEAAVNLER